MRMLLKATRSRIVIACRLFVCLVCGAGHNFTPHGSSREVWCGVGLAESNSQAKEESWWGRTFQQKIFLFGRSFSKSKHAPLILVCNCIWNHYHTTIMGLYRINLLPFARTTRQLHSQNGRNLFHSLGACACVCVCERENAAQGS